MSVRPTANARHLDRHGDERRGVVGGAGEDVFGLLARHLRSTCLEYHGYDSDVPNHRQPRDFLMGEHPGDGGVYVLLLVEGLVPGGVLVPVRATLGPVTARDGLDDHKPGILAPHLFHKRLVIRTVALVGGEYVVPGREHRLERVTPQGFEVGCWGSVAVACDADGPDKTLFLRLDGGLQGAAGACGAVEVFDVTYGVELKEVDVVHAQAFEGVLDLALRRVFLAQSGLGGEEDAVPDLGHPAPVLQL